MKKVVYRMYSRDHCSGASSITAHRCVISQMFLGGRGRSKTYRSSLKQQPKCHNIRKQQTSSDLTPNAKALCKETVMLTSGGPGPLISKIRWRPSNWLITPPPPHQTTRRSPWRGAPRARWWRPLAAAAAATCCCRSRGCRPPGPSRSRPGNRSVDRVKYKATGAKYKPILEISHSHLQGCYRVTIWLNIIYSPPHFYIILYSPSRLASFSSFVGRQRP